MPTSRKNAAVPPRGAGRPPGFERADAVAAAMDLFWKRGFADVTARDLAAAMGIQRSSFYNSFGTREAVFREALERYQTESPDAPLHRFDYDGADSPLATLAAVLRDVCRVRAADPEGRGCLVCNGVADLVGSHDELGPELEAAVEERVEGIERLLRHAVARGEITPPADVGATARSVMAFLMGLNTLSKVVRDERALWATCRSFLDTLGLAPDTLARA